MYRHIIRPLLFKFKPETAHNLTAGMLKFFFSIPLIKPIVKSCYRYKSENLKRNVFGYQFDNPIGLAAGFDKNADLYQHLDAFGFSFIEVGTVTPLAQPGNPKPRSFRLPADKALINRMGFNNLGMENASKNLQKRKNRRIIIGGNIGENTNTPNDSAHLDYLSSFEALYPHVDYFVVNVSCPNIKDLKQLQDAEQLSRILDGITGFRSKQSVKKPILLKVSPDLNDEQLDSSIETVLQYELEGFVATNTTTSRSNLATSTQTVDDIGNGGLSGQPLRERSTEVIRYIHAKTEGKLPIIGVGGIHTPEDAIEKLEAGATLIQLYTGFIYEGPSIVKKMCKAIDKRG